MKTQLLLVTFAALMLIGAPVCAQPTEADVGAPQGAVAPPPGQDWQKFDRELLISSVDTMRAVMQVPAAAVVIVHREEGVVFANGFGELPGADKAGANTRFSIGPASEVFTAVAILRLVEQGEVELDAPVTRYLPGVKFTPEPASPITVRQLLHHRAGLSTAQGDVFDVGGLVAPEVSGVPGAAGAASRLDYALLGLVVEASVEGPVGAWMEAEVFGPLGMTSSALAPSGEPVAAGHQYVYGWTVAREVGQDPRFGPAMFAESSADDLGAMLLAMLRTMKPVEVVEEKEAARGRRRVRRRAGEDAEEEVVAVEPVVSAGSVEAMLTAWEGAEEGEAMGWTRERVNGELVVSRSGATATHSVAIALLPERDMGVVVLTNVNSFGGFAPRTIQRAVVELLITRTSTVFPFAEFALRLCLGILLLTGLVDVPRQLWRWRRNQFVRRVSLGGKRTARLVVALVVPVAAVVGAVWWAPMHLGALAEQQPDLVLALALAPPLWLVRGVLKAINDAWEERARRLQEEGLEGGLELL